MSRKTSSAPTAYSYVRFSSPEQAKGDSVRRQEQLRDAWIAKSGCVLDTSLSLRDEGVSAYSGNHRANPDRHALAAFLELVKRGRIKRGSSLVVESLDRLSREHIRPALTLLLNMIDAGIRIVQLLPVEAVYDENVEPMTLMMAIMELSRGHSESRMKSERVGGAWQELKRAAAREKKPITRRTPAWLRVEDDQFVVDKEKAATIQRVFKMAASGHGLGSIVKRLNAEGISPVGPADHWPRSYVSKLLSNRAVLGEYQPFTRRGGARRRPEGDPIPDYFPAIISENEWHAARAALVGRRQKGGRPTKRLNIFSGLLRDARDGGTLFQMNKGKKGGGVILAPYRAHNGAPGSKFVSFPFEVFERAVLSCLREIDPADIVPQADESTADQVLVLTGKWDELQRRIEKIKSQIVNGGEIDSLVEVLRTLEAKRTALDEELAEAQRAAASPLSGAWGDCKSLLDALDQAADEMDARTRLRGALRRMVEAIWCLFVAKGAIRIAAVQIHFAGGKHRDYLILHRPATGGSVKKQARRCEVRSFAEKAVPGKLDLSKREHARKLEQAITSAEF